MTYYPYISTIWLASDNVVEKTHQPWMDINMQTNPEDFGELRADWKKLHEPEKTLEDARFIMSVKNGEKPTPWQQKEINSLRRPLRNELEIINLYLDDGICGSKTRAFYNCDDVRGYGRLSNISKAAASCQLMKAALVFDHDGLPIALETVSEASSAFQDDIQAMRDKIQA